MGWTVFERRKQSHQERPASKRSGRFLADTAGNSGGTGDTTTRTRRSIRVKGSSSITLRSPSGRAFHPHHLYRRPKSARFGRFSGDTIEIERRYWLSTASMHRSSIAFPSPFGRKGRNRRSRESQSNDLHQRSKSRRFGRFPGDTTDTDSRYWLSTASIRSSSTTFGRKGRGDRSGENRPDYYHQRPKSRRFGRFPADTTDTDSRYRRSTASTGSSSTASSSPFGRNRRGQKTRGSRSHNRQSKFACCGRVSHFLAFHCLFAAQSPIWANFRALAGCFRPLPDDGSIS